MANILCHQGTPRRKKKIVHRTATAEDKKLQSSLKKLVVNNIAGIEEVRLLFINKQCHLFLHQDKSGSCKCSCVNNLFSKLNSTLTVFIKYHIYIYILCMVQVIWT